MSSSKVRRARAWTIGALAVAGLVAGCVPVDATGGSRSFFDLQTTVHVPPDAVTDPVTVTAERVADPLVETDLVPGTGVDLAPVDGWLQPLQVELVYDEGSLPADVVEGDLRILRHTDPGGWTVIPGSTVDPDGNSVIATTPALGRFALGSAPVATVDIAPGTVIVDLLSVEGGGTWEPVDLSADVRDAEGRLLGRPVGWTINPSGAASIDADGTIDGLAPGTTTAVATSGGVVDSVPVCVGGGVDSVSLQPGSGPQLPPTLYLEAAATASCGQTIAPMRYFWSCQGTDGALCNTFRDATGGNDGGTVVAYEFPIAPGEIFNIGVYACLLRCSPLVTNNYDGSVF